MADLLEMAPSLYRLRIPGEGAHLLNCYLWRGPDDGVTLVDTGWAGSAPVVEEALTALGRTRSDLRRIVLTHFHEDHAGSAAELARWSSAEVVAGADDAPFVEGRPGPLPRLTPGERQIHPESDVPPQGPPCRVDVRVSDGDVLDFAGGARVISVPGHTPGSVALYLPAVDALLTGDAVAELNGEVILGVFNTDRAEAVRSLTRLADTGAQVAGFGHGEVVTSGAHERIRTASDPFAE